MVPIVNPGRDMGRLRRAMPWAFLAFGLLGCRQQPQGFARFVPEVAAARNALTSALDAWQHGMPPGALTDGKPGVMVVDSHRRPDQTLQRYEILGHALGDNYRRFAVRLILDNPSERPLVHFNVFGIDPIWVFRQEDYDMISHWEHSMSEPKPPTPQE